MDPSDVSKFRLSAVHWITVYLWSNNTFSVDMNKCMYAIST